MFDGRVAVITGAGSGIGRALALELAGRGARLALSDVDPVAAADTAARCEKAGAEAVGYAVDVADRAAMLAHAERVVADFGGVDLVVNNAGVALVASVADSEWADLDWIVGVNLWGVVHGTKAFLPHLVASGDGYLVNISSVFGFVGVPTQSAYNATKFAVRGFTEALRQELLIERVPVTVSCVHPGGIRTNIARSARSAAGAVSGAGDLAERFERLAITTPERAAKVILHGVQRRSARILVGPDAYLYDAASRLLGASYQRLVVAVARLAARRGLRLGGYPRTDDRPGSVNR